MCHFYADALSILCTSSKVYGGLIQPQHLEAIRTLPSFREYIDDLVESEELDHAYAYLTQDEFVMKQLSAVRRTRQQYVRKLLQSLHLLTAIGNSEASLMDNYIGALAQGLHLDNQSLEVRDFVERLSADDTLSLLDRLITAIRDGDPVMGLEGWENSGDTVTTMTSLADQIRSLKERSQKTGKPLKSKYSSQSTVLRTTVVAHKVQLSEDTAALTPEDKEFRSVIDKLMGLLTAEISLPDVRSNWLYESFTFDADLPHRNVFNPCPGKTFEQGLAQPQDFIDGIITEEEIAASSPATAIVYRLYQEAGSLINVADLWSAYFAIVGDESTESGYDERTALVHFYRSLAELRAMGFVKQSRRKADHIGKVKWM
jgi:origin recognition complex subunit 3